MPGQFCRRTARLLLFVGGPIFVVYALGSAGLRLNTTPSVPTGLYWISSDPDAEYVEFCPPEPFGTLSVARGYRARSAASCPDGGVPLLKPVVAWSGDIVEVAPLGIFVNRIPIPNTAPKWLDTIARPLVAWPVGRYDVAAGTVWVASSYNSRSFDSRYFGPISETAIQHHLRPLWTE
jgi:conjugative transfer signal peptidase TraF